MSPSDPKAQQSFTSPPQTPPAQPGRASVPPPNRSPAAASAGRRFGVVVVGALALLALLLSAFAAVNSWRVASSVDDLKTSVEDLKRVPETAPTVAEAPSTEATAEATIPDPDTTPTGSVPTLNAQTQFTVNYTSKRMRIPSSCGDFIYIDLDEPRIQTASGVAELKYYNACSTEPPKFSIANDGVRGSEVQSESVTPAECTSAIQLSPLPRSDLPIRQGQVYCVMTSLSEARASAQSWKMVIVSVTSVGQDDTVGLEADAWDIPS